MRPLFPTLFAIFCCLSAATTAAAQEARGTIQGRVSDSSGGTIPGATINVTSRATGVVTTATSNAEGSYAVAASAGYWPAASTTWISTFPSVTSAAKTVPSDQRWLSGSLIFDSMTRFRNRAP